MNEHFGIKGKAVIVWDFLFSCSSHTPWTQSQINWWTDSLQSLWLNHVPKKINIVGQGVDSPLHKLPSINSNALGQSSLTPCFWRWSSVVRLEKPLLFVEGWTKKVWIKSQGWCGDHTAIWQSDMDIAGSQAVWNILYTQSSSQESPGLVICKVWKLKNTI